MFYVNFSIPTTNQPMNQAKVFAKAMENFNDGLSNVKQVSQMLQEQEESIKNINTRVSKVEQKEDESIKNLEIRLSKLENEGLKRKRKEGNLERETNKRFKQMESSVQQRIDSYLSAKSDAETSEQSEASNNASSQIKKPKKYQAPAQKRIKFLEFTHKQQREHAEQFVSKLIDKQCSTFHVWRKIPSCDHAMIAFIKKATYGQPYYEAFPHQGDFGAFCKHWFYLQDAIKYRDQIFKIIGIKLQFNEQMTHYKLIKS